MAYIGPEDLTQYFIRNTTMQLSEDKKSVIVEAWEINCVPYSPPPVSNYIKQVFLGRRLLGTILTVYVPSTLLVIISYMTNFFKPFFFEAVVAVNLTVMLVI